MSDDINRALGRVESGLSALGKRVDRQGDDLASLSKTDANLATAVSELRSSTASMTKTLEGLTESVSQIRAELLKIRATRGLAGTLLGLAALGALFLIDAKRALMAALEWARLK